MDEQGGAGLSSRMIVFVADARAQWAELDRRITAFDAEFVRWAEGEQRGSAADDNPRRRPDRRIRSCRRRRCGRARHAARLLGKRAMSRPHRNVAVVAFDNPDRLAKA